MKYYDIFSYLYDLLAPDWYYHKPRKFAIEKLDFKKNSNIIVLPCGTGQSFKYLKNQLKSNGLIIGIDYSEGMLTKARKKIRKKGWDNIITLHEDAARFNKSDIASISEEELNIDAIYLELGLSAMPEWKKVIDKSLSLVRVGGKIVIMDWYMEEPNLWGRFIDLIGNADVTRPTWEYLKSRKEVKDFNLNHSFKNGGVFVASGYKV
ncbi:class I SAM-dependent methyltransferase [Halanaerobium sp. ST460_2HS_T2]|uniref:class I SAM-dependent methyltransferase n=1 Tax=Halanaerobium sp. ST460_2HS_T2 TaxID=2183914 RepID=UPI000DF4407C|nr:methyltransferase domain-containing protein [Halanaerobium sp. ST460_2HS_T2]RCW58295.1 methyltransferase family protein [Halanaerobium sp. ST460_2HS_T2]